jgi:hypothetical protein
VYLTISSPVHVTNFLGSVGIQQQSTDDLHNSQRYTAALILPVSDMRCRSYFELHKFVDVLCMSSYCCVGVSLPTLPFRKICRLVSSAHEIRYVVQVHRRERRQWGSHSNRPGPTLTSTSLFRKRPPAARQPYRNDPFCIVCMIFIVWWY